MKRRICKNCKHRKEDRCHAHLAQRFRVARNDCCRRPEKFEVKK